MRKFKREERNGIKHLFTFPLRTFVGQQVAGGANIEMRTRNQSNRRNNFNPSGDGEGEQNDEANKAGKLSSDSRVGVDKLLKRVKSRGGRGKSEKVAWPEGVGEDEKVVLSENDNMDSKNVADTSSIEAKAKAIDGEVKDHLGVTSYDNDDDDDGDESIWEDGCVPYSNFTNTNDPSAGMEVDISWPEESYKKKPSRRVSAEEKEIAENVHKVNLLCLLARGRLVDKACDDSLIQAALLSLLPKDLHEISDLTSVTKVHLVSIVNWFQKHFSVCPQRQQERSFHDSLTSALEAREGTPEEIAALSVALFRALNLTTRFVSILDVSSLKGQAEKPQAQSQNDNTIFKSSTLMVERPIGILKSPTKYFSRHRDNEAGETSFDASDRSDFGSKVASSHQSKECPQTEGAGSSDMGATTKRKGDLEFERQLQMALSATAVAPICSESQFKHFTLDTSTSVGIFRKVGGKSSLFANGVSTALGSRKIAPPLYWAEVYCTGESSTGRWVHVDTVNNIIDGEQNVEAISAACKISMRYVVAFAGFGAKDVTRRYCQKWYTIASKRTDSIWWDKVLAPLKELELRASGAVIDPKLHTNASHDMNMVEDVTVHESKTKKHMVSLADTAVEPRLVKSSDHGILDLESAVTRSSLEDMELTTKALTEPLPTNQQAYKNHALYAIERWLSKFQILHPKGPVLGFVSGHPVYPRSCVQTLRTKDKWLREGLQLKPEQLPAKVLKRSKVTNSRALEDDISDSVNIDGSIELYGVWQTEPLCLPPAVNGIVPKNERGQVDVWSEKCLPPGTVHLKFPRLYPIAKRLGIDSAPAMVGFEFKNGRSFPVFNGIVVCSEFENAIMEAYREVEERREAEERKRKESQTISRWYQLLSSILTRQRLDNCYANNDFSSQTSNSVPQKTSNSLSRHNAQLVSDSEKEPKPKRSKKSVLDINPSMPEKDHQHVFLTDDEVFDEENSIRTKWCHCGFSVQVEEM